MKDRMDLHRTLVNILGPSKPIHVYFQPPETVKMEYPAIVYEVYDYFDRFADNDKYLARPAYTLTVIDKDPESKITQNVLMLPMCSFNRHFNSDNLNHDVFRIYI